MRLQLHTHVVIKVHVVRKLNAPAAVIGIQAPQILFRIKLGGETDSDTWYVNVSLMCSTWRTATCTEFKDGISFNKVCNIFEDILKLLISVRTYGLKCILFAH